MHADGGTSTPVLDRPGPGPGHAAPRRPWPWVAAGSLALALAGATGVWLLAGPGVGAAVAVTGAPGEETVTVTGGRLDLEALRERLGSAGHGDLLATEPGGVHLTADLVVADGARLTVADAVLLLRSDERRQVRVAVQERGHLDLDRVTVVSWSGSGQVDADPADGRADVVASGEGTRLDVERSTVSYLGSGAEDPGPTWRDGAAGRVVDSTFTHNYRGAYANRSGRLEVEGSTFAASLEDGLTLRQPAAGSTVESSVVEGNAARGLWVHDTDDVGVREVEARDNGSAGITLTSAGAASVADCLVHGNGGEGLNLHDAADARVTGTTVWDNRTGIAVASGRVRVEDSAVSGNLADGVLVTGTATEVDLERVRLDHNDRAGLWVTGSRVAVTDSVLDRNDTGVRVDETAELSAQGNSLTRNVRDGFALVDADADGLAGITGNTVAESGLAAVSVIEEGDLGPLLDTNTVDGDQSATRVREPEQTAP